MAQTPFLRFRPMNRLRLAVAGVLVALCLMGLWRLATDIYHQIDEQSGIKLDNVQWALSQVEVELVRLVLSTEQARFHGGPLSDVRLRFDLFYSRLAILKEGKLFEGLRRTPEFAECMQPLEDLLATFLPLIDGPDAALRQGLPDLSKASTVMITEAREVALTGVNYFAQATDQARQQSTRTLLATLALTVFLITALLGLIVALLRLNRDNRNQAAQNLQTLSRLDAIISTAQEAIITLDDAGRIVDFNQAATQTFGYDRAEAVGADLAGLISDPDQPQTVFRPGKAPGFWGAGRIRLNTRHKSGHSFLVELSISQTESDDGPLYVAFLRDMSAQQAAEEAMMAARDEALAGEKAKSDLLVVMSHEIRTPLNGMIGTIDLLGDTPLLPHQKEYLRVLEASGRLLMHHVNDVLDIARLDSGKATGTPGPVDLDALVQEVLENQTPAARHNGNAMRYIGPVEGGTRVLADGALLRQVLLNLVGNAVKFTQGGKIVVQITHDLAAGETEIGVSDTGIGIAAADIDRIFEDFVTLDASYARKASGTGLGLGIVRRIISGMGGRLSVDSTPGKGSLFRVILPLPVLSTAPAPPALPAGTGPATLVIEDNDFNRMIIRDMLRAEGHEVVEARDGVEGISLADTRRFDLILMDISMPRVDGLQAARAIAGGSGPSASTPILAMTAHALAEDSQRFKAAGMRDALIKPITRTALQRALGGVDLPAPAAQSGQILVDISVLQGMQVDLGRRRAGDLVERFLTETGQSLAQLLDAGSALDPAGIREIHRLEGSAAMFGAQALRLALSQIQTLWKSGNADQARCGLPGLQALWDQTMRAYSDSGFLPQLSSLR